MARFTADSSGALRPNDVVLATFRRHGISAKEIQAVLKGDVAAVDRLAAKLLSARINTDKPRAWLAEAVLIAFGPCRFTTETAKRLWFGAHDYIAMLVGPDGLRSLGAFDEDVETLPETFMAWRAEWNRSDGFLTDARCWALRKEDAVQYLRPGKVLTEQTFRKGDAVLRIPPHKHASGVDEVLILKARL